MAEFQNILNGMEVDTFYLAGAKMTRQFSGTPASESCIHYSPVTIYHNTSTTYTGKLESGLNVCGEHTCVTGS